MKNNREKKYCSHFIFGAGYTGLIAAYFFKQKGVNFLIAGTGQNQLFDIKVADSLISPLPIFPVDGSTLYKDLNLESLFTPAAVSVEDSATKNCSLSDYHYEKGSFAEFIYAGPTPEKRLALSMKHWGTSILTKPYLEIQSKINRHYLPGMSSTRIGYVEGLSLYWHFIKKEMVEVVDAGTFERIDYPNKIFYADKVEIHYEKLISTVPINLLFDACDLKVKPVLHFEAAYFLYFTHLSSFGINRIIYDYDMTSDVVRVIGITEFILAVQLPAYKKGVADLVCIKKKLEELIPFIKEIKFEKECFFKMSYPLEPIADPAVIDSKSLLIQNSIIPFGRFGNWEYSDLHELNWKSIF